MTSSPRPTSAVMAGRAGAHDDRAAAVGARIEDEAKASRPSCTGGDGVERGHRAERPSLLGRLRAALAA